MSIEFSTYAVPFEDLFDDRLAAHWIECERGTGIRVEGDMNGVHGLLSDKHRHVRVTQDGPRLFYEAFARPRSCGPGPRANDTPTRSSARRSRDSTIIAIDIIDILYRLLQIRRPRRPSMLSVPRAGRWAMSNQACKRSTTG
jgi:hypothetical protein